MSTLLDHVMGRAQELDLPISVHFDLTYRCNERCVHCYLDHEDHGELTTREVKDVLDQLAAAGTLFLIFSGGELLLRTDFFELLEYARALGFDVKLKTNAMLIKEADAIRIRELGVRQVQVSIYSHRAEVHDGITKVAGSLDRSIAAIRFLKAQGLRVLIANVLMRQNAGDYPGVQALAAELGVGVHARSDDHAENGRRYVGAGPAHPDDAPAAGVHRQVAARRATTAGDRPADEPEPDFLDDAPCSAGHTACYVSPYGDIYPCVQFPLPSGNLRRERFDDIWRHSQQLEEVRAISLRDLPTCSVCSLQSNCTRCPGLAYMEGNMRGPSSADCEKSLVADEARRIHEAN